MEYQLSSCVYISVTGYLFVLYRMGIAISFLYCTDCIIGSIQGKVGIFGAKHSKDISSLHADIYRWRSKGLVHKTSNGMVHKANKGLVH